MRLRFIRKAEAVSRERMAEQKKTPEDEIVFYTLDGTVPTKDSYIYQEPIEIKDASQQENVYAARTDLSADSRYVFFPVTRYS